jgi:propionyl-CoA carboxylase beta chain
VYRNAIESASDKEAARREFIADYRARFANPYKAAELGFIDEVIAPREVRTRLVTYLRLLRTKRDRNPARKHGNIPL